MEYQQQIDEFVRKGWRIEQQTETHTLIHKGNRIRHSIHIVTVLLTAGLWLFVYIPVLAFAGLRERRIVRMPDGSGRVDRTGMFGW